MLQLLTFNNSEGFRKWLCGRNGKQLRTFKKSSKSLIQTQQKQEWKRTPKTKLVELSEFGGYWWSISLHSEMNWIELNFICHLQEKLEVLRNKVSSPQWGQFFCPMRWTKDLVPQKEWLKFPKLHLERLRPKHAGYSECESVLVQIFRPPQRIQNASLWGEKHLISSSVPYDTTHEKIHNVIAWLVGWLSCPMCMYTVLKKKITDETLPRVLNGPLCLQRWRERIRSKWEADFSFVLRNTSLHFTLCRSGSGGD